MMARTRLWLGATLTLLVLGVGVVAGTWAAEPAPADRGSTIASGPGGPAAGESLISRVSYEGQAPAVAYNPDDDQYLIVWAERTTEEESTFYGQVYAADGLALGESFQVLSVPNVYARDPRADAAYNATHDQYLVVVHGRFPDILENSDVYGRIFSAEGAPQGEAFPISRNARFTYSPAVISGGGDEYLVVWTEDFSQGPRIYGQRVRYDGELLDNPGTPEDESDPGIGFLISTESHPSNWNPAVAYHESTAEYLVVWEAVAVAFHDIIGQRVIAVDGALQGGELLISTASEHQEHPSVAYNADAGEYLVVWADDRLDISDIYGQRLAASGSLLDNPGTPEDETDPDVNFVICGASHRQEAAAVVFGRAVGQYLVAWQDQRHEASTGLDVYGIRVAQDGSLDDEGEFAISQAAGDQQAAAVAAHTPADPWVSQYLVVWQDARDGLVDHIYGQRVWWPGLLLGHDFALAPPRGDQEGPAVAFDPSHGWYLAVWADERAGDFDIYAQLLDRDGIVLNDLLVIYEGPGDQTFPAVVFNAVDNQYLVVWQSATGGNPFLGGRLVSGQGTPLPQSFTLWESRSLTYPAVAFNPDPEHKGYLVTYSSLDPTLLEADVRGWMVSADGQPEPESFVICDEPDDQWGSAPTHNPATNEFLVVWADERSGDLDIYGQRVAANMELAGDEIAIAMATLDQDRPAIAHDPLSHQYLVVWDDQRSDTTGDIYIQRIDQDGSLLGGNAALPVTAPEAAQIHPDVTYVNSLERYRIVWSDNRDGGTAGWDIYGQWLNADGTFPGTLDSPVARYWCDQQHPAIVYDPGYDQALTVWEDGRSGTYTDIYASMNALDRNPPVARFVRRPIFGQLGQVFGFSARPSFDDGTAKGDLRVRWDVDGDGNWDAPLSALKWVTTTYGTTGMHEVTLEVWDGANQSGSITLPIFVYDAGPAMSNSPPTATLVATPTWGAAGTPFEFDGTGSTGGGPLEAMWDWENDGLFDTAFSPVLTATHTFTVAGDYAVRLLVRDTSTQLGDSAFKQITVQAGEPVDLVTSPDTITLVPGEVLLFRAAAWDAYGNRMRNPAVAWSVTDPAAGQIDAGGVFTAGWTAGVYADAILVEGGGLEATASVIVAWPSALHLPLVLRDGP